MTLISAILNKVKSKDSIGEKNYSSPPPELDETAIKERMYKKKKKHFNRYSHVRARVDSTPPRLQPKYYFRHFEDWKNRVSALYLENVKLLIQIKRQHFLRVSAITNTPTDPIQELCKGKVDCRWEHPPKPATEYYEKRRNFLKQIQADNRIVYERIVSSKPRVMTTAALESEWRSHRRTILGMAAMPFVLFPPVPKEDVDALFVAPRGIKRPRVKISLRVEGGASMGSLTVELFSEVCPLTCQLFTELVDGDTVGHGYVGTSFFSKVPYLYWSGGDVIYDNGFGCYAQVGRRVPIGAENYHYPHSTPGLLSMRVTANDEMCGIFNITFKPLPQFDLKNVVFGRVIRPCSTYDAISSFGSPLSTHPRVIVSATRRRDGEQWTSGRTNTRLQKRKEMMKGRL